MKTKKGPNAPITEPLLRDLMEREKLDKKLQDPTVSSTPLPPASLYQDSGSGYNTDFTFPQD